MNTQNNSPMPPRMVKRAPRPRSFAIVRDRAVNHLGSRRNPSDGSGRVAASGIKDLDQFARRVLTGEAQEDLLEPFGRIAACSRRTKFRHRSAGANGPL